MKTENWDFNFILKAKLHKGPPSPWLTNWTVVLTVWKPGISGNKPRFKARVRLATSFPCSFLSATPSWASLGPPGSPWFSRISCLLSTLPYSHSRCLCPALLLPGLLPSMHWSPKNRCPLGPVSPFPPSLQTELSWMPRSSDSKHQLSVLLYLSKAACSHILLP